VEFLHGKRVGAFCECCMPGNTLGAGRSRPLHTKWLFISGTPHTLGFTLRVTPGYTDPELPLLDNRIAGFEFSPRPIS
jgi:hypothetical protein